MSDPIARLQRDVSPGIRYRLTFSAEISNPSGLHPALVRFVFLDAAGTALPDPDTGGEGAAAFAHSSIFGAYRYIGKPAKAGPVAVDMVFAVPENCTSVQLELHLWRAGQVRMHDKMMLAPASPDDADAERDIQLAEQTMGTEHFSVRPGESYDLDLTFKRGALLRPRDALVAFRFLDATGAWVDPPPNLATSDQVGAFRYVVPDEHAGAGMASITVPARCTAMQVRVLRWNTGADLHLRALRLIWLGAPENIGAQGTASIDPAGHYALRGRIRACGGEGTLLGAVHLMFSDDQGAPLLAQAEGLSRSDRFVNHIRLAKPSQDLIDETGSFSLAHAFVAPPGATRVAWRVLSGTGGWQLDCGAPLSLTPFCDAPLPQIDALPASARASDLAAEQTQALRTVLPAAPIWQTAALGRMHLLGQALCAVQPDTWIAVTGQISGASQAHICPLYFDKALTPLPDAPCLGCASEEGLGPARSVALQPQKGGAMGFDESFLTPPNADFAAFHLVAPPQGDTPPEGTRLVTSPRAPDAVCGDMDVGTLTPAQLRSTVQLAEAVGHLRLQAAACHALAVAEPGQDAFARRAQELDEVLEPLDPGWLPTVAGPVTDVPDPGSVFYLMTGLAPEDGGADAVRNAALLQAQVAGGLHPVVCLPLAQPEPGVTAAQPDGQHVTQRDGLRIIRPGYRALDPARMPPAALLELETDIAGQALHAHACGLIHACGDWDIALKALALATHHGLPFVYEPRAADLLPAAPRTRLHRDQQNRCIAAADAIIIAAQDRFDAPEICKTLRGRVFCLPDPADPAGHAAAYAHARAHHAATRGGQR
ncbi:hypothetical protein [Roseovarius sp. M141]|uniref:hypothetical protein n=1 Tax=Roseovarius sp. M141 TaxID=2583806 RepID=UPI0020CC9524|nr:hypothetical protein [Roseovarius sp. M141]